MSNGLVAKAEGDDFTDYPIPPAETHVARCVWVIDLGTHTTEWKGQKKRQRKVRFHFELPNCKVVFDEDKGMEPFMVSQEYTLSLYDTSHLRKVLESWRGVKFEAHEVENGYDVTKVANAVALVGVIHEKDKNGKDRTYANISTVVKITSGTKVPEPYNEILVFMLSEFSQDVFDKLPKYIKKKIMESEEWSEINNPTKNEGVDTLTNTSTNNNEGVDVEASTEEVDGHIPDNDLDSLPF